VRPTSRHCRARGNTNIAIRAGKAGASLTGPT
jgi:hypothetical protein